MPIEKSSQGNVVARFVEERRSGIDRRELMYDWHIPERRRPGDRRKAWQAAGDDIRSWQQRQQHYA